MKTIAAFLILFLSTSTVFSQDGWYWQNPSPQGNLLYDVCFMDESNGWAVGAYGIILYSSDFGTTWTKQESQTVDDLFSVFFLTAENGWAVGVDGCILHWDGNSWEFQHSGTDLQLHDVYFINSQSGWAVGQNETVLRTSDGGETWTSIGTGGSEHYFSVHFMNADDGYLVGAAGSNGVIRSTSDGGEIWGVEIIPANRMNSLCFTGTHTLWAVGDNGAIFYKADADSDWLIQDCGSSTNLNSVSALNEHQVWLAGDDGIIYHSNSDGSSWFPEESHVNFNLKAIQIFNGESGWAVGDAGSIVHTYNGGGTWTTQSLTGPTRTLRELSFSYPDWGVVVGDLGTIYSSLDGGNTWLKDTSGVTEDLYALDVFDYTNSWSYDRAVAVGYGGTILRKFFRTDEPYRPWELREYNHNEDLFGVDVRGTKAWAAGHFGSITISTNSGREWNIMHQDMGYHLYDICHTSKNYGWAVGMSSMILHTQNAGLDWEEQTSPVNTNFHSVYFTDIYSGWAVGLQGNIIHTKDGGKTWTIQNSGSHEFLTSVYFTDQNNGWISGTGGTILHTNNGGETWRSQTTATSNVLWSVYFADPVRGWACGEKGSLLSTNDGGGVAVARVHPSFDLGSPILDLIHTGDTLMIQEEGMKKALTTEEKVVAVEVVLDSILHSAVSDLEITLSHNGVVDTLVFKQGGDTEDFIKLKLSDVAEMPIDSGVSPFTGTHKPFKDLSAFYGLDPLGEWILDIYDSKEGNTGILDAWTLILYTGEIYETTGVRPRIPAGSDGVELFQNYPNPLRELTTISYFLPRPTEVDIGIYNIMGQLVESFPEAGQNTGKHQLEWNPRGQASGIYFIRLRSGSSTLYRKMLLID